ncbi:hypothetical protein C8J57DRAFT_655348 [Mycena rebaudengoi]|nr:hypothetical protein C8J57DRAFT_655348 [Mycena rebaudengoi]
MAEPPPQSVPRPNIAEKNNRLFALFQRKLAVDTPESYIVQAEKFTQWLKNEKAYYLEARHQIINILLTAQFTLRRSAGLGDDHSNIRFHVSACRDHPLTETYTQLVLAIQPYQSRFVEPHFQDAVRGLLATVLPSPDPSLVPPGPRPFSVVIDRSQQMRPSSSSLASALEPQPISSTGTNIPPPSSPRAIATPQAAAIGASQPTVLNFIHCQPCTESGERVCGCSSRLVTQAATEAYQKEESRPLKIN